VITTAGKFRLIIFGPKLQLFYTQITEQPGGGGERGEGCHPSDLLCLLPVIWSGAPTDSLGEAHRLQRLPKEKKKADNVDLRASGHEQLISNSVWFLPRDKKHTNWFKNHQLYPSIRLSRLLAVKGGYELCPPLTPL
jgi:hypothetical protein